MPYDEEPLSPDELRSLDERIEQALRARWPPPPTPRGPLDPRLMQELRAYYAEQARAIDHQLGRVWQRLEQHAGLQPQPREHPRPAARSPSLRARRHPSREAAPPERARPRGWARLSALTAAVLLVALVGGLIAGLVVVGQKGHGTNPPAPGTPLSTIPPSATTLNQANLLFSDLRMTSATTGWTVATPPNTVFGRMEAYKVLRTSDGGRQWQDVTPPFTDSHTQVDRALPILPLFLNDATAWMLDLPTTIFQTVDGGHSWQAITTPAEVAQYTFIDRNDGWVLGTDGGLYQTTDDGKTWTKLQSASQGQSQPGILPYNVNVTGIFFLNARDGWMTGQTNQTTFAWVYVTHDGGKTWQREHLSLPPEKITPPILVTPPSFVGDQDGFLWVNLDIPRRGGPVLELYSTQDGGATWQDRSVVPEVFPGAIGTLSFGDGSHGWVSAQGETAPALWMTSDGGQQWSPIDASSNLVGIGQLDFISQTTGWALSFPDGVQSQALLQTEDGGHTWAHITYRISG